VDNKETAYGINTGFGKFKSTAVTPDQLRKLHHEPRCGGGLLPVATTRRLFALRLNVLAKGHSGISHDKLN
jgi:histidine ammonia-lyase